MKRREGEDEGGRGEKKRSLEPKMVSHLKDAKFGGKEGGAGWPTLLEDLMVVMGSVDRGLEAGAKRAVDLTTVLGSLAAVKGLWVNPCTRGTAGSCSLG